METKKLWTVKEVCQITGLTRKHLYYYHHENVARAARQANYSVQDHDGYKEYDDAGLAKLRQIAMYYDLGLKRNEIRDLMKAPGYDMHQALDTLHAQLTEKRDRIDRHLAAIDQLRTVGTKNELLEWFGTISLEDLGRNTQALARSSLEEFWIATIPDQAFLTFTETLELLLPALSRLDDAQLTGAPGRQILEELQAQAVCQLGLPGYLMILSIFLSAIGEGDCIRQVSGELPVSITAAQARAAMTHLRRDWDRFLAEAAKVIAVHHTCIGATFDESEVKELVAQFKDLLAIHFGLKHEEEYRVLLEVLDLRPFSGPGDYLGYLLNALKYHCENHG